jgi:hypothetical protein
MSMSDSNRPASVKRPVDCRRRQVARANAPGLMLLRVATHADAESPWGPNYRPPELKL